MSSPSATLTVWAASWLAGDAAPDDVIDALAAWAPMHLIGAADAETAVRHDLEWPGVTASGVPTLLRIARSEAAEVRLVLPTAGDVRGLPTGTEFARAAIATGEGIQIGAVGKPGVGLVPSKEGPDVLRWTVFPFPLWRAAPNRSDSAKPNTNCAKLFGTQPRCSAGFRP
ncbi:hypothetical protein ACETU7_04045 [Rhodococcus sp. 3Y1]